MTERSMLQNGGRYMFQLHIAQDGEAIVDVIVGANAVPEEIGKAKKTLRRMLDEFTPKIEALSLFQPDLPAQPAPRLVEEASSSAVLAPAIIRRPKSSGAKGAKGLMILHCETCGDIFVTVLKGSEQELTCKCGSRIDLTRPMASFRYICPCCEKKTWGKTNVEEPDFETRCLCGNKIRLVWVVKDKEYRG